MDTRITYQLGIIALFLTNIGISSSISNNYLGPEVVLSRPSFYTNHSFVNLSNGTRVAYLLPITFKVLEFNCTANYSTSWKFATPPYIDERLKDISITKSRYVGNFSDPTSYIYHSSLRLNFKHPVSVPQLFCRFSRKADIPHKMNNMVTAVNSIITEDKFQIRIDIVRKNVSDLVSSKLLRVGQNKDCRVRMNVSLEDKTFFCQTKNGNKFSRARPQLINCNNPDECNSIFLKDDHYCGNITYSKGCNSSCLQLSPSNSPGVIICYDQNDNSSSIARRFLVTQTRQGLQHLHLGIDNDFEEETIYITSGQESMYDDQNVTFYCNGTGSYYTHGFQWAMIDSCNNIHYLGNGTEAYLQELQIYNVTKTIHLRKNQLLNCSSPVEIICYGPRWNLATWVNASMTFDIKEPAKPKMMPEQNNPDCPSEEQNITRFTCKAVGSPCPEFKWILEIEGRKSELRKGFRSSSTEGFHYVNSNVSGNISNTSLTLYFKLGPTDKVYCVAINYKGNDSLSFDCPTDGLVWVWNTWMISALSVVSVALVLIIVAGVYVFKRQNKKLQLLSDDEIEEFEKGDPNADSALLLPYNMEFEIPREQILMESTVLGEGQFGIILLGQLLRAGTNGPQQVAIKTYKKTADVGYLKALLSEIKIMSQVGKHPNLVNLIGASTRNLRKREVLVLIEFCKNGNLLKFLRQSRGSFLDSFNLSADTKQQKLRMMERGLTENEMAIRFTTTQNLVMWAYECANAMEYLSNKKVIHGDLAARNVLLTDTLHAKVGDFGLSKQLFEYSIYVQKLNCPLPLKWMAIESLQDLEFSVKSDIWSFGITLWEIFSLGQSPYPGHPQWNFQSYTLLQSGYRMDKPEFSNRTIHKMMLACWDSNPDSRPSFTELKMFFLRELHLIQGSSSGTSV